MAYIIIVKSTKGTLDICTNKEMFVKFGCILNMKLNSIFHESNACLPRGVLGDKINSTCNSLNDCKKTPPIIGKKKTWLFMYCKSLATYQFSSLVEVEWGLSVCWRYWLLRDSPQTTNSFTETILYIGT